MSNQTLTKPSFTDDDVNEPDHVFCECNPNMSLCGVDLTHVEDSGAWDDTTPNMCPMCVHMNDNNLPCSLCGE